MHNIRAQPRRRPGSTNPASTSVAEFGATPSRRTRSEGGCIDQVPYDRCYALYRERYPNTREIAHALAREQRLHHTLDVAVTESQVPHCIGGS